MPPCGPVLLVTTALLVTIALLMHLPLLAHILLPPPLTVEVVFLLLQHMFDYSLQQ